ncbi:ThuA domain-containing protein [Thermaurantiacus sp.]
MTASPGLSARAVSVRIEGHLVVGGASHDFDRVRLELLGLAARDPRIRLRVSAGFEEFLDGGEVAPPRVLLSYTCNVAPSEAARARLQRFLAGGGRWFALHATNSLFEWRPDGVACRGLEDPFLALIGSAFQAHPPLGPFLVEPVGVHPLTAGIGPFEVTDELYLSDVAGDVEVLLAARFCGHAAGFVRSDWTQGPELRPLMTLRRVGDGALLHLALGHCRGVYDAPHRAPVLPAREEGPWEVPAFRALVARGLAWAAGVDPATFERAA